MTSEDAKTLKPGDVVWFLCTDTSPGVATRAFVTSPLHGFDEISIRCCSNPKCEGHDTSPDRIFFTEIECYDRAIQRTSDSISYLESEIDVSRSSLEQEKKNLDILRSSLASARSFKKFKSKPFFVHAYQTDKEFDIVTLEGTLKACKGDWIVRGLSGELYPVKPDVFSQKYEEVSE